MILLIRIAIITSTISAVILWSGSAFFANCGGALSEGRNQVHDTPPVLANPVANGAAPIVSPDNKYISFVSSRNGNDDVYVISSNGSAETQLTETNTDEILLGFEPGGARVVYSREDKDKSTIYSITLEGKEERKIGEIPGHALTISPDGKALMSRNGSKLAASALDGSNLHEINGGGPTVTWNPRWSYDSKYIAFSSRTAPKALLGVYVMKGDGSEPRLVSQIAPEESGARGGAQCPSWSYDGARLAFQVNNLDSSISHVWIVNLATGKADKLGAHTRAYVDELPSWFPDGKRIAFQSDRTGRMEIWLSNADGSDQKQLTGLKR